MVQTEFEKIMLEHVSNIEKELAAQGVNVTNIKEDITGLKENVSDLCNRTTKIETERDVKVKAHDRQIKLVAVFSPLGSFIVGIITVFHLIH